MLITFMISMLAFPFASAAVAKLIYTTTQKGEIFGAWQKVLNKIHPKGKKSFVREFWYKRLGGCITCMRQFVAELTFIAYITIWHIQGPFPTYYIDNQPTRWVLNILIFITFCAIALTWGQLIEYEKSQAKAAEAEEKILTSKVRKA